MRWFHTSKYETKVVECYFSPIINSLVQLKIQSLSRIDNTLILLKIFTWKLKKEVFFKSAKLNFFITHLMHYFLWAIALTFLGLMIFGIYPNYKDFPETYTNYTALPEAALTYAENIMFDATSKVIWAVCVAYIIYSCLVHGGIHFILNLNYSVSCDLAAAPALSGLDRPRHRHRPIQTGTGPALTCLDRHQSRAGLCRSISTL